MDVLFILTVLKKKSFFFIFSQEKSRSKTILAAVVSKDCIYLLNFVHLFFAGYSFYSFKSTVHNYNSGTFGHFIDLNRIFQTFIQSNKNTQTISDAG